MTATVKAMENNINTQFTNESLILKLKLSFFLTGWPLIMALTLSFFFYVKILVFFDENLGIYISEYALLEYISLFTITLLPSLLQA
jgi:hypothetical protein